MDVRRTPVGERQAFERSENVIVDGCKCAFDTDQIIELREQIRIGLGCDEEFAGRYATFLLRVQASADIAVQRYIGKIVKEAEKEGFPLDDIYRPLGGALMTYVKKAGARMMALAAEAYRGDMDAMMEDITKEIMDEYGRIEQGTVSLFLDDNGHGIVKPMFLVDGKLRFSDDK